jgi:hypothetical protein
VTKDVESDNDAFLRAMNGTNPGGGMGEVSEVTDHLVVSIGDADHRVFVYGLFLGLVSMRLIMWNALQGHLKVSSLQFVLGTLQRPCQQWRYNNVGMVPYLFGIIEMIIDLCSLERS